MTKLYMFSFEGLTMPLGSAGREIERTITWRHVAPGECEAWEGAGLEASRICERGMSVQRITLLSVN